MRKIIMLFILRATAVMTSGANAQLVCEEFGPGWTPGSPMTTVHMPYALTAWSASKSFTGVGPFEPSNDEVFVSTDLLNITVARLTPKVVVSFMAHNRGPDKLHVKIIESNGNVLVDEDVPSNTVKNYYVKGEISVITFENRSFETSIDDFCIGIP